jgi:hypothetical protein
MDSQRYFTCPNVVATDKWHALKRIFLVEVDPTITNVKIDQVSGAEAVRVLVDQTYHLNFILSSGQVRHHLVSCAEIASKVPICRLRRSPLLTIESTICSLISEYLA